MRKWIKHGAVCEIRGVLFTGRLYRVRRIVPGRYEDIQLESFDAIGKAPNETFWVAERNLRRTERCRRTEKRLAASGDMYQSARDAVIDQARELVEPYGYVVVRKMP